MSEKEILRKFPLGYTPETAMLEAARCLQCKKPSCVEGCPVQVDIPGFINFIKDGDFTKAIRNLWDKEQSSGGVRKGLSPGDPV